MDAYAFASSATPDAIADLRALVDQGKLRVVLPLAGASAVYAAAAADTAEELFERIDAVRIVAGLGDVDVLLAAEPEGGTDGATPTWVVVAEVVGFARMRTSAGATGSVHQLAAGVSGVVGVAVVTGGAPTVLVEVTGPTVAAVTAVFDDLGNLPGVHNMATSAGFAELGRGLRRG